MEDKSTHTGMNPINDSMLTCESCKIFQIMAEFVEGFERMACVKPSVSIFGSARTDPEHPWYKLKNLAHTYYSGVSPFLGRFVKLICINHGR